MKRFSLGFIGISCLLLNLISAASGIADDAFAPLKQRLIQEGFPANQINQVYATAGAPLLKNVTNIFRIQESKLNYDQFLQPSALAQARAFMQKNNALLFKAEQAYGVDRYVITSILLVETHFGGNTGSSPVLSIFSTFALMSEKPYRDQVWMMLPYEQRQQWGSYLFDTKLIKRAEWAYGELRALLQLTSTQPDRAATIRGSYMGAIGWPQFLPSSILRYGVDGNQDGLVDLHNPVDAIMSTANYLKAFGWRQGISRSEQEEVIYHYNHSRPYVNTILGIASRLQQ